MNSSSDESRATNKKILEPTFNFLTEQIKIGDDDSDDKIAVTELVSAGQVLAHFPNSHNFLARGYELSPIELGENTEFSEDESEIIATVPGYPKIKKIRHKDFTNLVTIVAIEPLFIVYADKMSATLSLHPILKNGLSLKDMNLNHLVTDQGFRYGIDQEALDQVHEWLDDGEKEFKKIVIARGQPVGKSNDAYLRFDIEIGPIAGTILDDGSIDFRERRVMVGVNQGQAIATKIPAIQGAPGVDVYGEETPAKEGKDLQIKLLNDATFSQETMQVTATKDGVLSVVNNNVIKVLSHQTISTDIGYETGNVESKNSITIQGSVQPGFMVTANGDVKILGGVMSGIVNCESNVVINGGITGKNSDIFARGDVDIHFIEQGVLDCGGICVLRKQSYYSNITAGSNLLCENLGKVVGGNLIAGGNISLWDVGGENAKPAVIAAGIVGKRLNHLNELKQSVIKQQDDIIVWLQRYKGSSQSKKVRKMEKDLAETKLLVLRVNLIPGAGIYSRVAGPSVEEITDNADYIADDAIDIQEITININGTVYAGTEIRIGNRKLKLEKTVSSRQFKLHPNGKRIIAVPLGR